MSELSPFMQGVPDPGVLRTYRRHVYAIARRRERLGRFRWVYNLPLLGERDLTIERPKEMMQEIFHDQVHPFRLNFSFSTSAPAYSYDLQLLSIMCVQQTFM